jgi:hypothetical protein
LWLSFLCWNDPCGFLLPIFSCFADWLYPTWNIALSLMTSLYQDDIITYPEFKLMLTQCYIKLSELNFQMVPIFFGLSLML